MSICQVTPSPPPQGAVYTIQWSDCKHGAKQFWHSLRLPDWISLLSFCFSWRSDALWDERNWVCPISWTNSVKTLTKHNNSTTLQSKLDIVCTPRLCHTTCAVTKSQRSKVAWGVQGVFLALRQTDVDTKISALRTSRLLLPLSLSSAGTKKKNADLLLGQNLKASSAATSESKPPRAHARAMLRWISHWAKYKRTAKDFQLNHNVTI